MRLTGGKLLAVGIVAMSLVACKGGAEAQVEGKWTASSFMGEMSSSREAKVVAPTLASVTLDLRKDKKFTFFMGSPFEGAYTVSGKTVFLKTATVAGMTKEQIEKMSKDQGLPPDKTNRFDTPMKLFLSADGKTLTLGEASSGIVFSRSPS